MSRDDRKPARLDPHGTETPRTRLVGHAHAGVCVGPGTVPADAIEDTATGERIALDGSEPAAVTLQTQALAVLSEVPGIDAGLVERLDALVEPMREGIPPGRNDEDEVTDEQWYRFSDVVEACKALNAALAMAKIVLTETEAECKERRAKERERIQALLHPADFR